MDDNFFILLKTPLKQFISFIDNIVLEEQNYSGNQHETDHGVQL